MGATHQTVDFDDLPVDFGTQQRRQKLEGSLQRREKRLLAVEFLMFCRRERIVEIRFLEPNHVWLLTCYVKSAICWVRWTILRLSAVSMDLMGRTSKGVQNYSS